MTNEKQPVEEIREDENGNKYLVSPEVPTFLGQLRADIDKRDEEFEELKDGVLGTITERARVSDDLGLPVEKRPF